MDRWGSRQLVAELSSCGQMVEGAGVAVLSSCGQMGERAGGSCTQFMWTDGGVDSW